MIELRRRHDGSPLVVGHRGAPALEPENTLRSFRAAVAAGVDLVEFDVIDLPRGPLVVAHSDHLHEVSHGLARGSVRSLPLSALRELAPELPTLDDALAFFTDEAHDVGLHVDIKLKGRLDELAAAVERHGLAGRTVVSSYHVPSLREVARRSPGVRLGLTYPNDRFGVSRRPGAQPAVALGLAAMRAVAPLRLRRLVTAAGASAVMLQHRLVTAKAVARARELGAPVLAWTVDEVADIERVVDAGVDGVITNDPRIVAATLRS